MDNQFILTSVSPNELTSLITDTIYDALSIYTERNPLKFEKNNFTKRETEFLTIKKGRTMRNNTIQPGFVSFESETEDTYFKAQLITFYEYLKTNVCTSSMVCDATGIPQKNATRFKRLYEKAGLLWQVEKKYCRKTKRKAWYITTNPEMMLVSKQLKLF